MKKVIIFADGKGANLRWCARWRAACYKPNKYLIMKIYVITEVTYDEWDGVSIEKQMVFYDYNEAKIEFESICNDYRADAKFGWEEDKLSERFAEYAHHCTPNHAQIYLKEMEV